MRHYILAILAFLAIFALCHSPAMSHGQEPATPQSSNGSSAADKTPCDRPGLQHVLRLSDTIYSGGQPLGDEGFETLRQLGITTVVSVDGARPLVERAHSFGLRYVHIPLGYGGIPAEAGAALARLVREVEAPIYFHCHHGQHRGPAAAAVACLAAGAINHRQALEVLERAGTSRDYQGLWRDVAAYTPPPPESQLPELVETAVVRSLAASMAQVDQSFDSMKRSRDAHWRAPVDRPGFDPALEALLIQETLHEAARNLTTSRDAAFQHGLADAERLAGELQRALKHGELAAAEQHFVRLQHACTACHRKYRD
jgi:protein tyrosine phosphatase (PTP) superfamily phosphohydrolase (DUF442 family)/soluble cytochrome b562